MIYSSHSISTLLIRLVLIYQSTHSHVSHLTWYKNNWITWLLLDLQWDLRRHSSYCKNWFCRFQFFWKYISVWRDWKLKTLYNISIWLPVDCETELILRSLWVVRIINNMLYPPLFLLDFRILLLVSIKTLNKH